MSAAKKQTALEKTTAKMVDLLLAQIARDELSIDSLTPVNHDGSDFKEVHVGSLKKALQAAFAAGFTTGAVK